MQQLFMNSRKNFCYGLAQGARTDAAPDPDSLTVLFQGQKENRPFERFVYPLFLSSNRISSAFSTIAAPSLIR